MLLMGFEPAVIRLSFSIPTNSKNRCHKYKSVYTPDGTRTHNLWIRSPTPYPLGHRGCLSDNFIQTKILGICFTIKPSRISRFSAPIIEPSSLGKSFFLNAHLCTHFPQKTKKNLKVFEKYGTLHEFACHPCAGAMLIFSVSFQF